MSESPSPQLLPYKPEGIPQALRAHPHWLVCNRSGVPVIRNGVGNSKTVQSHWVDFTTASRIAESEPEHWPYIVLTDDTPFTVFDVDFKPARNTESATDHKARIQRATNALELLRELLPVRYESRSKSGNGFHIIVRGKFDGTGGKGTGEWSEVEIYTSKHGVALTGHVWEDHDNPDSYPDETLQDIRDMIKSNSPRDVEDIPTSRNTGSVPREFAKKVLNEIDRLLHGSPGYHDWRDIASAVCDGVGEETALELLEGIWPEEKRGEYRSLIKSLKWFAPWDSLNAYLKGSSMKAGDWVDPLDSLPLPPASEIDETTDDPFPIIRAGDSSGMEEAHDFVESLLTEAGASVVYGPSNCGKSFWVIDLAACIAAGRPFRDMLEVDQGAVIYVALEGSHGAKNRIEALKREGKLAGDAPLFLCFAPVSLMSRKHAAKLAATTKDAAAQSGLPCRLVILDTLARAMAGGDENSGKDMGAAVKCMDAVREATGAHVMLVHHCGKDEARGARGHSCLRAAVDTEIELFRPEGERVSTVRVTKQRDLQIGELMPFSLKVVALGTNRRGKPITSCVVHHEAEEMAAKPGRAGRKAKASPDDMLRYLPAATVKEWQERVREETGLAESQFYAHKKTLEATGRIRRESGTSRIVSNDPKDGLPDMSEDN